MQYTSHHPNETKQIAQDFAATLVGGEIIGLEGELGAGKTAFVQAIAEFFQSEEGARSPTFSLVNIYHVRHPILKQIVHIDLYRLKQKQDLVELGLDEWFGRKDTIVIIEWPELLDRALTYQVTFKGVGEDPREISIAP